MSDKVIRLACPSAMNQRLISVYEKLDEWIRSSALSRLVEEFGFQIPDGLDTESLMKWLLDFSERWDFRRLQQEANAKDIGEGARWLLDNSQMTPNQIVLIEESAKTLGLIGMNEPLDQTFDYVLVLGGARLSCLLRPRLAAEIIRCRNMNPKSALLLASSRPVSDSERDATDSYAPGAATEFDLINAGAEASFQLENDYTQDRYDAQDNPYCSWIVQTRRIQGEVYPLISISAPSSEPDKRRANSSDTFEFLFSKYAIEPGSKLLLVTSAIYVPYQQLEAIRTIALPRNVFVETVGFEAEWGGKLQGMAGPTNYLQEIRSTIQSANRLIRVFPRRVLL